jgi:hypothetical protein
MDQYEFSNTAAATALNDGDGINATDTTIVVDDGSSYPTANFKIQMESEVILIVSRSGNTMTVSTTPDGRGWDSTTAASHADNTPVKLVASAEEMSQVPRNSWLDTLFRRPSDETVHADDDEFSTDSSGDWTEVDPTGTTTWSISHHMLNVRYEDQEAPDVGAYLKSLGSLTSPLTIETWVTMVGIEDAFTVAGLVISDGTATTSNAIWRYYNALGTQLNGRSGTITNMSTILGNTAIFEGSGSGNGGYTSHGLRLIWSASNTFKWQVAIRPGQWSKLGTTGTDSFTITPTHFGFGVATFGTSTEKMAHFDYFRVYESDKSA